MAAKKTDLWHAFLKLPDYNRYALLGVVLGVAIIAGLACGMSARVPSPINPSDKVSMDVFNSQAADMQKDIDDRLANLKAEADKIASAQKALNAKREQAEQIVARRNDQIKGVLNILGGVVATASTGQPIPIAAWISSAVGLAGLFGLGGTVLDKKRRTSVKKELASESTK